MSSVLSFLLHVVVFVALMCPGILFVAYVEIAESRFKGNEDDLIVARYLPARWWRAKEEK